MARERDYLQPGTVVRHARNKRRWGVILAVSSDGKTFSVRWRGEGDQDVGWSSLIRAAAPCGVCGERADAHKPEDHDFVQEKTD